MCPGRVLVVEDHPLTRVSVATVLRGVGWEVTECATALDGARVIGEHAFTVALVDLDLPDRPGVWLIRQLRDRTPETYVAALTATTDEHRIIDVLDAGAAGYISKRVEITVLPGKVADLAAGIEVFDDVAAAKLIRSLRGPRAPGQGHLSPREVEVLGLLANGADTAAIAATLHLSANTVKDVVRQIFRKMDVRDRAAAVAEGFRRGLIA
jgi:DNA-binding NarL/FixJ family response regulator